HRTGLFPYTTLFRSLGTGPVSTRVLLPLGGSRQQHQIYPRNEPHPARRRYGQLNATVRARTGRKIPDYRWFVTATDPDRFQSSNHSENGPASSAVHRHLTIRLDL